jgi:[acyl-carrier-protein] S-malonyltransferase
MKTAFVFPGQGSQKVGMGRAWAEASAAARATFDEADQVLGFALSRLCWEGPEEELGRTANTQPALLATSIAILRAVRAVRAVREAPAPGAELRPLAPGDEPPLAPAPAALAGHSLGEYSALVAAESLAFADALRLVRRRGELMQEAVPLGTGAMAAILGLDPEAVAEIAAEAAAEEVCAVANLNAPGQTVIAGHTRAIDRAVALAQQRGARKAMRLPVSAPFHSPLMRPAREAMAELLAATEFHDPRVPVVSNVDARPVATAAAARDALVRQIDGPVRWVESVEWMAREAGIGQFLELGSGGVLSGLNRRIAPETRSASLSDPEQLARWQALEAGPETGRTGRGAVRKPAAEGARQSGVEAGPAPAAEGAGESARAAAPGAPEG